MKRLSQLTRDQVIEPIIHGAMFDRVIVVIDSRQDPLFELIVGRELHAQLGDARKNKGRFNAAGIEIVGQLLALLDQGRELVVLRAQLAKVSLVHIVDENFASPGSW